MTGTQPQSVRARPTKLLHSIRCIQVIAGVLGRAGEAGKNARLEAAAQNVITYAPAQGLRWRERKTGTAPAGNQRLVPDIERYSSAETMPES